MADTGAPLLLVVSGLPGVGKTTVARGLATRRRATLLRIDTIEQAMRNAGIRDVGAAGYAVANALAEHQLRHRMDVVVDCADPVPASRAGWRAVADRAGARLETILLVCSDAVEHRRRVERREPEADGLVPPTWAEVRGREFVTRDDLHHRIDTAVLAPEAVLERCWTLL